MNDSLDNFNQFIFDEMMTHPALFTHGGQANKIALINNDRSSIVEEILKHEVGEVWQVNGIAYQGNDTRVRNFTNDLTKLPKEQFNIIIALKNKNTSQQDFEIYLKLLTPTGMLVQESDSLFNLLELKKIFLNMYHAGFHDLQILHFPQPARTCGSSAAMLGTKNRTFQRLREKEIFNRSFTTRYYNFDVHKAALTLPEFIREALAV